MTGSLPATGVAADPAAEGVGPRWDGRIEGFDEGRIRGWAVDLNSPGRQVWVEVHVDGRLAGGTLADLPHPGSRAEGLGDEHHGFILELDPFGREPPATTLSVVLEDGTPLPLLGGLELELELRRRPRAQPGRLWPVEPRFFSRRAEGREVAEWCETTVLAPGVEVQRPPLEHLDVQPQVSDPEAERRTRADTPSSWTAPPLVVSRVPGGLVDTTSFLICASETRYLLGSVRKPGLLTRRGYRIGPCGELEPPPLAVERRGERALALGSFNAPIYFHWVIESLVRGVLFGPLRKGGADVCVTGPLNRWQRESLAFIGIEPEQVLELAPCGLMGFRDLFVASRAVGPLLEFVPAAVRALAALAPACRPQRRIYASRQGARWRRVRNEAALVEVLSGHGFEVVQFGNMTFTEQVRTMAETEVLLALHGSDLVNLVFAPDGARVIEVLQAGSDGGATGLYRNLAAARGLRYGQIVSETVDDQPQLGLKRRDVTIDCEHLDAVLARVLAPQ